MRYRGRKATSAIDWDKIDYVVGTRDDVTHTGIERPCRRCGHSVFTSRHYPERVSMVCEVCALEMAKEEEAKGEPMQATVILPTREDILNALDPWRRMVEAGAPPPKATPETKNTLAPSRRGRPRSGEGRPPGR